MTIYTTQEKPGYGKQNYSHYEYRLEGGQVLRYHCRRQRIFFKEENEWVHTEKLTNTWGLDDPELPKWIRKYLPG